MIKSLNFRLSFLVVLVGLFSFSMFGFVAYANHSWGGYHWARTTNPFAIKLGDNVTSQWDTSLQSASGDWSLSDVLDTAVVAGQSNPKNCRATKGLVEVCNNRYGNNGWLGIASIWVNGSHIAQGTVKLNDTYFNTAKYNTPAWRNLVMCQEVGHTLGLDHQDENFSNPNLGTCMDYTSDPSGTLFSQLSNGHPNTHDYEELGMIYGHPDSFNSFSTRIFNRNFNSSELENDVDTSNQSEWGKVIRKSRDGRSSIHERDLGRGNKVFTFVIWAN